MHVVLIGATGRAGSRILTELLSRGHSVTAAARELATLPPGVVGRHNDLSDVDEIVSLIVGADAVISAYAPPVGDADALIAVTRREISAVRKSGDIRLIVVGGAGSLYVTPGTTLLESGQLPSEYVAIAMSHQKALDLLRASDIDWTYLSPAAIFEPGERTAKFRVGKDELVTNANQISRISMEDYAVALVDELEKPAHRRERFSVGY